MSLKSGQSATIDSKLSSKNAPVLVVWGVKLRRANVSVDDVFIVADTFDEDDVVLGRHDILQLLQDPGAPGNVRVRPVKDPHAPE